jgi:hypothetical protein
MPQGSPTHTVHTRWWQKKGEALANEVVSICSALEGDYEGRRRRALESLKLYEQRNLKGLYAGAYTHVQAENFEDIVFPLHQSLVETAQAKIAGRQKPRPMFMTSGGDWKAQRRAKKLDKFVEAVLHQPQGRYLNGWQLSLDVFLDCLIWGVGAIKVYADEDEDRIVLERKFPFELYCDLQEARAGNPLNLFDIYPCDKDVALAKFAPGYDPEKDYEPDNDEQRIAMAIEREEAIDDLDETYGGTRRVAQQIRMREAWRLPLTKKKPGKHAIAINGTTLAEEEWTRPDFPFVILRWTGDRIGYWGRGMVEESESQIEEINRAAQRIQSRMKLCASKRTYVKTGSVDKEAMESNEDETIVEYNGDAPPIEAPIMPFSPMELEYLGFHFLKLHDTSGISHATATAKNEPGVTSGVAIQNLNDMQTERFAPKSRMFEDAFVGLGRQIVWAAQEHGSITVRLPALTMLREFSIGDASLEDDSYHVIVAPVSSMPNDPAGRIDLAEKMFNTGLMGAETYKRLAQMPDVEFELARENAEHNYLEDVIDRFLDWDHEEGGRVYESPEGFIANKVGAILQFGQAYFDAKLKGAPEPNLELLRRYILELDKMMQRAAQEAAAQEAEMQAKAMAGAAPPALGPGAPPGQPQMSAPPPGATVN